MPLDTDPKFKFSGDPDSTCGGYLAIDILLTGVQLPSKLGSEARAASATAQVVFLLTVNGRALRQVLRLIQRLDGPNSLFYVHVDARQVRKKEVSSVKKSGKKLLV